MQLEQIIKLRRADCSIIAWSDNQFFAHGGRYFIEVPGFISEDTVYHKVKLVMLQRSPPIRRPYVAGALDYAPQNAKQIVSVRKDRWLRLIHTQGAYDVTGSWTMIMSRQAILGPDVDGLYRLPC